MKKVLLCLCLLFCLVGCGKISVQGESVINGKKRQTSSSFSSSYDSFKGVREYHIKVNEDETLQVKIDIKTTSGKLKIVIALGDNDPIYTGTISEDVSFTVNLKQAGNYTVKIETNKHEGSYSFNWGE